MAISSSHFHVYCYYLTHAYTALIFVGLLILVTMVTILVRNWWFADFIVAMLYKMVDTDVTFHAAVMNYTILEMVQMGLSIHHGTFSNFIWWVRIWFNMCENCCCHGNKNNKHSSYLPIYYNILKCATVNW